MARLTGMQESSEEEDEDEEEEKAAPAPAAKKAKTENGAQKTKAADTTAAQGSRTIFVKNLPWSADEAMLNDFFSGCGAVSETRIGGCFCDPPQRSCGPLACTPPFLLKVLQMLILRLYIC